jgi:RecG-like helicase
MNAERAVTWARDHVFERAAVDDRRTILESALARGIGETTYAAVEREFWRRVTTGEFREVAQIGVDRQFTTTEMLRLEKEIIVRMQESNRRGFDDPQLVSAQIRVGVEDRHPELSSAQRRVVDDIFTSQEKMIGLDGVAGAGKTTTLSVIRESVVAEGYQVDGFAPTSRAAQSIVDRAVFGDGGAKLSARWPQNSGERLAGQRIAGRSPTSFLTN